jgi:hypothetical protein
MIKLTELLKLNEIGEGIDPYPYEQIVNQDNLIAYKFIGKYEQPYIVKFKETRLEIGMFNLSFYPGNSLSTDLEMDQIDRITNRGDALRIVSTVVEIVKDAVKSNNKIIGISFIGSMSSDKERASIQRDKLYAAYIKKNIGVGEFKDWKLVSTPSSSSVKIKKKTKA